MDYKSSEIRLQPLVLWLWILLVWDVERFLERQKRLLGGSFQCCFVLSAGINDHFTRRSVFALRLTGFFIFLCHLSASRLPKPTFNSRSSRLIIEVWSRIEQDVCSGWVRTGFCLPSSVCQSAAVWVVGALPWLLEDLALPGSPSGLQDLVFQKDPGDLGHPAGRERTTSNLMSHLIHPQASDERRREKRLNKQQQMLSDQLVVSLAIPHYWVVMVATPALTDLRRSFNATNLYV